MNSDHELGIKIKITADTSAAKAAAQALDELTQSCDPAGNNPAPDEPRPKDAPAPRNDTSPRVVETPVETAGESAPNRIANHDPKEFPRELRDAVTPPTTGRVCHGADGLGQAGTGGVPAPALEMQTRGNQFHDSGLPAPPRMNEEWLRQFQEFADLHERNMEQLLRVASRLAAGSRSQGRRVDELERAVESLSRGFDSHRSFTATGS
jgi:hypothetical protein